MIIYTFLRKKLKDAGGDDNLCFDIPKSTHKNRAINYQSPVVHVYNYITKQNEQR